MSTDAGSDGPRHARRGLRRSVRLITEGNYPESVGGVTRWCDLLLSGLPELDWEVLALGVPEGRDTRCGVRIRYPNPSGFTGATERYEVEIDLIRRLSGQLFGDGGEPLGLLDALLEVRRSAAVLPKKSPVAVRSEVMREVLVEIAPSGLRAGTEAVSEPALEAAIDLLDAVLNAATTELDPLDVTLSATAGVAAVPGILERFCNGTPLVVVEHGIYVGEAHSRTEGPPTDDWTRWIVRRSAANLARLAYLGASAVVGVSEANVAASQRLGADPKTSVCIPNGVDAPPSPPPVRGSQRVGTVARIDPLKGVDLFIEAAALVGERFEQSTFTHVGPAEPGLEDYHRWCHGIAQRADLGTRLAFVGSHDDPPSVLPRFDVQLIPSRSEGMPFSLLEGMAAGRPIVATAVGGVPEALGDAGLIIGPDDAGTLADATSTLLADPEQARRLGRLAHAAVRERYPLQVMLDGYRELFDSVQAVGVA